MNLAYFTDVTEQFELDAALIVEGERRSIGHALGAAGGRRAGSRHAREHQWAPDDAKRLKPRFRKRVFIDLDPGYTQFWHAAGPRRASATRSPLLLQRRREHRPAVLWHSARRYRMAPDTPACGARRMAVVAFTPPRRCVSRPSPAGAGRSGASPTADLTFGAKAHEFRKFVALPTRSDSAFEIALESIRPIAGSSTSLRHIAGGRRADKRGAGSARVSTVRPALERGVLGRSGHLRRDANPAGSVIGPFAISRRASRRWCRIPAGRGPIQAAGTAGLPHAGRGTSRRRDASRALYRALEGGTGDCRGILRFEQGVVGVDRDGGGVSFQRPGHPCVSPPAA